MKEKNKGKKEFLWTAPCEAAFREAKEALASATLLHHPSPASPTALHVDASGEAIGAELAQQDRGGSWRPVAFFSKGLTAAQRKYSAFDRELLAIYASIKHFRHFLEGRPFTVFTDHKPLTYALASSTDRSPRQANHLSFIAEFTSDIQHIKGSNNVVADALSWPLAASCEIPSVDFDAFAAAQGSMEVEDTSLVVSRVIWRNVNLLCDTSTGSPRPLVPAAFRRKIFDAFHSLSHAGARPTIRLVAERFVWPGLRKDVREWCRQCHDCQCKLG